MPSPHERESLARDRLAATASLMRLHDIADQIYSSRNLVDAAYMAVQDIADHQQRALTELLTLISERLSASADALMGHAGASHTEGATDVA